MAVDRVKFQDIVASQVPDFVKDDFPLLVDFLKEKGLQKDVLVLENFPEINSDQ